MGAVFSVMLRFNGRDAAAEARLRSIGYEIIIPVLGRGQRATTPPGNTFQIELHRSVKDETQHDVVKNIKETLESLEDTLDGIMPTAKEIAVVDFGIDSDRLVRISPLYFDRDFLDVLMRMRLGLVCLLYAPTHGETGG